MIRFFPKLAGEFWPLAAYFDGCRMKRNDCEYDFAGGVSDTDADGLLKPFGNSQLTPKRGSRRITRNWDEHAFLVAQIVKVRLLRRRSTDNLFKRIIEVFMAVLRADQSQDANSPGELSRILRMEVPVIVKLGERKLMLSEVMRLGVGAIIEFSKRNEEPLELLINNKTIALGETVKVGENFGLRITQVGDIRNTIQSLAGANRQ
ncbi:MAG TPA: FliM/FliN family flagellar motor switch protein [Tepidisphaeraceae bacterium]|nr:FliM/FliN family flagellar motor switch protein [Tepidisphaeraceae bacterium]